MRRGQPRQSTSTSATRTLLVSFFFSSRRRHTRSCLVSWARDVYKRQGSHALVWQVHRAHEVEVAEALGAEPRAGDVLLPWDSAALEEDGLEPGFSRGLGRRGASGACTNHYKVILLHRCPIRYPLC